MPNLPRERILSKIINKPGWDRAAIVDRLLTEKRVVTRRSPDSDEYEMVHSRRRLHWRNGAKLEPLDLEWQDGVGNRALEVNHGPLRFSVPNQAFGNFTNGDTVNIRLGANSFALTGGEDMLWRNDIGQTELALAAQSVAGAKGTGNENNIVRWENAYGLGVNYDFILDPDLFYKIITFPSVTELGTSSLPGTKHLYYRQPIDVGPNTEIWYYDESLGEYAEWDKSTTISTPERIEFRNNLGDIIYVIRPPYIKTSTPQLGADNRVIAAGQHYDALGNPTDLFSWYELSAVRANIFLSACFDYDILQGIVGSFELDDNIDLDGVDANDGEQNTYASAWNTTKNYADIRKFGGGDVRWGSYFDLTGIGSGDTIDSAYLTVSFGTTNGSLNIRIVDDNDRSAPASYANTTTDISNWSATSVAWSGQSAFTQDQNSPSIVSLIEDAQAHGDLGTVGIWMEGTNSSLTGAYLFGYAGYQEEIHIVYTAGGGGTSIPVIMAHLRQQGIA